MSHGVAPLTIPPLAGTWPHLHSRLAQRRADAQGVLAGDETWHLGELGRAVTPAAGTTIALTLGGAPAELDLAPALLGALTARLPLARDWAHLTPGVRALLLEWAALPYLHALETLLASDIRCADSASDEPLDYHLPFTLRLGEAAMGAGHLRLSAQAAERVLALLEHHLPGQRRTLAELPLPVALLAGWQRLYPAECRALQAGDVLMLEDAQADTCTLHLAGGWQAQAQAQQYPPGGLRLLAGFTRHAPAQETAHVSDVPSPPALDALPLIVQCRLGSLELTLAQVQALGPGSVLELPRPAGELVELVVNGQLLGRGELVTLGTGIGVRVTRFGEP